MIQAALDSGAFDKFVLSDGMIGQSLVDAFPKGLKKSFGTMPGMVPKDFFKPLGNASTSD